MQYDYENLITQVTKRAIEYRKVLTKIIEVENGDYEPLEKKIICQKIKEQAIQDYCIDFGASLVKEINYHLQMLRGEKVTVDADNDEFTLRDFLQKDRFNEWLIPTFLTRGSFVLLAAKAKSGKTDFIQYLTKAITIPEAKFLGCPCQKGPVLIFQVEESQVSIRLKAKQHGFSSYYAQDTENKAHPVVIVRTLDLANDIRKLEKKIEQHKPILVIIDTIRGVMSKSGLNEIHSNFSDVFYQVQAIAIRTNITFICLHHTKKGSSNEGGDLLDLVAGNQKLVSIGSGTIVLIRNEDSHETYMHMFTRDIDRRSLVLDRTMDNLRRVQYTLSREIGVSSDYIFLRNKILFQLKCNEEMTETELYVVLKQDLSSTLDQMCRLFMIDYKEKDDELVYFLPPKSIELWESILNKQELETIDLATKVVNSKDSDELKKIGEEHTQEETKDALSLLSKDEKLQVWMRRYPPEFGAKAVYQNKVWLCSVESLELGSDKRPIYKYRLRTTIGEEYPSLVLEPELEHEQQLQHEV